MQVVTARAGPLTPLRPPAATALDAFPTGTTARVASVATAAPGTAARPHLEELAPRVAMEAVLKLLLARPVVVIMPKTWPTVAETVGAAAPAPAAMS